MIFIQDFTLGVNIISRQPGSAVYQNKTQDKAISILHNTLRHIIADSILTEDSCVALNSVTVENIVKNCCNGVQVSSL